MGVEGDLSPSLAKCSHLGYKTKALEDRKGKKNGKRITGLAPVSFCLYEKRLDFGSHKHRRQRTIPDYATIN